MTDLVRGFVVTGTDTGVGKTTVSAVLMLGLGADYWKPIQSGTQEATDTERVARMTELPRGRFHPERYILSQPLSPHRSAELDHVSIEPASLVLPELRSRPLLIEGAGGLLVPLTRSVLFIDVFVRWNLPVILCARTSLGTINHTLLSLEALRRRGVPVLGLVFVGDENRDNQRTICDFGQVSELGRLPWLDQLGPSHLSRAFVEGFSIRHFGLTDVGTSFEEQFDR